MRNRAAEYLAHKPNFIRVAGWSFGVLFSLGVLWQFGSYGGIGWWLLLIVLAAPVSWFWAHGMWFFCGEDFERIASASRARSLDDKHDA